MKIVILDPHSSDPTWGPMEDALILDVTQDEMDKLDDGVYSVRDLLSQASIQEGNRQAH